MPGGMAPAANSVAWAWAGRRSRWRAGRLAGALRVECADLGQSLAEARQRPPQPSGVPLEVERQAISRALDGHYRRILDEPMPALGNHPPRSAAKTPDG